MKIEIDLDARTLDVPSITKATGGDEIADSQEGYNEAIKNYIESTLTSNLQYDDIGAKITNIKIIEEQQWLDTPLMDQDLLEAELDVELKQ